MKSRLMAAVMAVSLLLSSGCVPSIHPLHSPDTEVRKKEFEGKWIKEGDLERWMIEASSNGYKISYFDDDGEEGRFEGHLVQLGDSLFLDLTPEKMLSTRNSFYAIHVMPVHTFMKIEITENTFKMAPFNPDWAKGYLEKNPDAIKHTIRDKLPVLTADTPALQAFIRKHHEEKDVFGEATTFARQ